MLENINTNTNKKTKWKCWGIVTNEHEHITETDSTLVDN